MYSDLTRSSSGQLSHGFAPTEGFEARDKQANEPLKLEFPDDTRIAKLRFTSSTLLCNSLLKLLYRCGRSFATALDRRGNVWTFIAWGIPYRYAIPVLYESRIVDIECGWDSACALTESGEVYFWRPQDGELWDRHSQKSREFAASEGGVRVMPEGGVIKCRVWEVTDVEAIILPPIPSNLPSLKDGGKSGVGVKLIKLAAGLEFLIGLTNGGHVLGMDISSLNHPSDRPKWVYVSPSIHAD